MLCLCYPVSGNEICCKLNQLTESYGVQDCLEKIEDLKRKSWNLDLYSLLLANEEFADIPPRQKVEK